MDEVDAAWIRFGATALAAIALGSTAMVVAATYMDFVCASLHCDLGAVVMVGIVPAWGAMGAVAGGRWGWCRDVPTGAVAALFLAFMALHFASVVTWGLYGSVLDAALGIGLLVANDETGTIVAFLVYWSAAGAVGMIAVWQSANGIAALLARREGGRPETAPRRAGEDSAPRRDGPHESAPRLDQDGRD